MPPLKRKTDHDVVLSSGFLGFSRHLGFLRCVEERGAKVEEIGYVVVPWSVPSGLPVIPEWITKSFITYSAKSPCREGNGAVSSHECAPPSTTVPRPRSKTWKGPAVGVGTKKSTVVHSDPLPPLEASCGSVLLKRAVVHGKWCTDGGVTDRIECAVVGLARGGRPGFGSSEHCPEGLILPIVVVRSPRSGASCGPWTLGANGPDPETRVTNFAGLKSVVKTTSGWFLCPPFFPSYGRAEEYKRRI